MKWDKNRKEETEKKFFFETFFQINEIQKFIKYKRN